MNRKALFQTLIAALATGGVIAPKKHPELVFGEVKGLPINIPNNIKFTKVLKLKTLESQPIMKGVTPTMHTLKLRWIKR